MASLHGKRRVAIAGGGIGGLSAALALLRSGVDVDVYEQAQELKEVGAGFLVTPNAVRAIGSLGILDTVMQTASVAGGRELRLWNTGQTWSMLGPDPEQYGAPFITVYRPDLLDALAQAVRALKPDAIHLASACSGYERTPQGIVLRHARGTATADALVGADGVHSTIREQLAGEDAPRYSGVIAWRGMVPMDRVPERMRRHVTNTWVGPGAHLVQYPVHGHEYLNVVGNCESAEAWTRESWNVRGTTEEFLADFQGWHEDVQFLIRAIEQPFKWALMAREPMKQWGEGLVTLLGDACHPTLPFLAQGAGMAMEDACILARALQAEDDIEAGLRRYERARIERTTRIVLGSTANARRYHSAMFAEPATASEYIANELSPEKLRGRLDWIYGYDVDTVPI